MRQAVTRAWVVHFLRKVIWIVPGFTVAYDAGRAGAKRSNGRQPQGLYPQWMITNADSVAGGHTAV